MMKNILCFVLIFVLIKSVSAQVMYLDKTKNDLNSQLDNNTEELKQFNVQVQSFEATLELGNKAEIAAAKLLIEQTMLREIQQRRHKNTEEEYQAKRSSEVNSYKKTTNHNRSVNIEQEEKKSREERGEKYLEEKNKARGNTQNKPSGSEMPTKASNPVLYKQERIYNAFKSISDFSSQFNQARLNKSVLAFYDTMQEDLEEKKKEARQEK